MKLQTFKKITFIDFPFIWHNRLTYADGKQSISAFQYIVSPSIYHSLGFTAQIDHAAMLHLTTL
jgi:hypothetical protein